MIDWQATVENKLTEFWLWEILNGDKEDDATDLIPIVWDYENGVRPNKSFLGLKTNTITNHGSYLIPETQRYDADEDLYYQEQETSYSFVVSMNAFGKDAQEILMMIAEAFEDDKFIDMLTNIGIAYLTNEPISDISELETEGQNFEKRWLMDVFFNFSYREEKVIDVIETIEIGEGTIGGYNDPDSSIKIVEIEKIFNV